jgi:hypothetical protein
VETTDGNNADHKILGKSNFQSRPTTWISLRFVPSSGVYFRPSLFHIHIFIPGICTHQHKYLTFSVFNFKVFFVFQVFFIRPLCFEWGAMDGAMIRTHFFPFHCSKRKQKGRTVKK